MLVFFNLGYDQRMPNVTVVRLPTGVKVIGAIHLLRLSAQVIPICGELMVKQN